MEIGFALMKNKKLIKFEKGVNLDVREIAKILKILIMIGLYFIHV